MSDVDGMKSLIMNRFFDDQQLIKAVINGLFFSDYGTVTAVQEAEGTVTVEHAVRDVLITDEKNTGLPPTITGGVEVLYPMSGAFGIKFPIAVGDGVLLVGLRNYLPSTDYTESSVPPVFQHYTRNTLKAIPVRAFMDPTSRVEVDETGNTALTIAGTGKYSMKNDLQSLKTVLSTLIEHVRDLTTINCVPGSPVTLSPTTILNLSNDILALGQLLEE